MKKNLLLLLGSILFGLLLLEGVVRLLGLAPESEEISSSGIVFSTNPKLRYVLKPGGIHHYQDTTIAINPDGYRGELRRPGPAPAGTKRVLCIGDSITMGLYLEDGETWCAQLEEMLNRDKLLGRKWEVLNLGVIGYNTVNEVELLKEKGLAYRPDYVVLQYCFNDHRNRSELDLRFKQTLVDNHRLVYALTHPLLGILSHSKLFLLGAVRLQALDPNREEMKNSMRDYYYQGDFVAEGLAEFKQLSERYGFAPLVLIFPKFEKVDRFAKYAGDYRYVVEPCRKLNLPYIELLEILRRDYPEETPYPAFHYDSAHPTARGCAVAAAAVERYLAGANP